MALQSINLGIAPSGVGGDNYRQAHTKINANFVEVGGSLSAISSQGVAIGVNATAIADNKTELDNKNLSQDGFINTNKGDITALQGKDNTQDTAISTNAGDILTLSTVTSTHSTDIANIKLKDISQDDSIDDLVTLTDTHVLDIARLNIQAGGETVLVPREFKITGDAAWSVTFDGTANVSAAMTIVTATTAVAGKVRLNDTVTSTSKVQAATANAVKQANDKASAAIATTQKGIPNGVAALGADGVIISTQLPTLPDDAALQRVRILALAGL